MLDGSAYRHFGQLPKPRADSSANTIPAATIATKPRDEAHKAPSRLVIIVGPCAKHYRCQPEQDRHD